MRLRRLPAALALSALALSGCSGDTNGDGTSTTSSVKPTVIDPTGSSSPTSESPTSSSASSTTEAAPDGPPEEAKANTKEGAEAFAKWYLVESGDSLTDGDTSALTAATSPDCRVCLKAATATRDDAKKLGLVTKNPYKVSVVRSAKDELGVWRVKLKVEFDDYEYVKDGKPTMGVDSSSFEINPELKRKGDKWLVSDWLVVQ